jgi:hypothetical protein
LRRLARGIQFKQLARELFDRLFDPSLDALPIGGSKSSQRRDRVCAANILGDTVDLIDRHEKRVAGGVA